MFEESWRNARGQKETHTLLKVRVTLGKGQAARVQIEMNI